MIHNHHIYIPLQRYNYNPSKIETTFTILSQKDINLTKC